MSQETENRVVAVVRLVAMLCSSAAAAVGFAADADIITMVLLCLCAVGTIGWGWWKNSNMTEAAQLAQLFLDEIKNDEKKKEDQ